MNNIITSDKAIIINKEAIPKSSREVIKLNNGVRLFNVNKNESVDYITEETTIDGVQAESPQQLFDYFLANGFKSNSGGGSDVVVDQEYNPTSANAQSGTAVAEGIKKAIDDITPFVTVEFTTESEYEAYEPKINEFAVFYEQQ